MKNFLLIGLVTLLYSNDVSSNNNSIIDNDDDYFDNYNLRVDFYKTYNECVTTKKILYRYVDNLYINCDCDKNKECFDKLNTSTDFKKTHFIYNKTNYYLTNFIYNDTCYNYNNKLWINAYFGGYKVCLYYIYIIIFVTIVISISCLYMFKLLEKSRKIKQKLNNSPPDYQTINLIN